jgi:hypothetical protein
MLWQTVQMLKGHTPNPKLVLPAWYLFVTGITIHGLDRLPKKKSSK